MDTKARLSIPSLSNAFDAHLELRGRALGTRLKYRASLQTFAEWAGDRSGTTVRAAAGLAGV